VHDAVQKVMVGLTSLNEVRGLAATAQDRP
jgi:hypothetical protein